MDQDERIIIAGAAVKPVPKGGPAGGCGFVLTQ
jgi:hypothetical protein